MIANLLGSIVGPLSRRLVTIAGAGLSTFGMSATDVATVTAAIPLLVALLFDVGLSNIARLKGWK